MKFSQVLTSVALAAAAFSASAANLTIDGTSSPYQLLSSTATIQFTDDVTNAESSVVGAFSVASISLGATGAATLDAGSYATGEDFVHVIAPVSSVVVDTATGSFVSVASIGGMSQTAPKSSAANGGTITISNLTVDFATKQIFGDVSGSSLAGTTVSGNKAIFTFQDLVGPSTFTALAAGQTATFTNTLTHLTLTTAGVADIKTALGLKGIGATTLNNLTDFGSIVSTITVKNVTPAVPEPSTYAMLGVGLAMAGVVARRRRQA